MTNENYREKIVGKELKELCIAVTKGCHIKKATHWKETFT